MLSIVLHQCENLCFIVSEGQIVSENRVLRRILDLKERM